MTPNNEHYRRVVQDARKTRFFQCGYADRFDPFTLDASAPAQALYRELFHGFAHGRSFPRLLDIGCGTGIYFDALSRYAERVDAIDCAPDMIHVAHHYCTTRALSQFNCIEASAQKLPFKEQAFDAVIAMDLLHHVDEVETVLDEVYRTMKPGGRFLVLEPNICNPLMALAHALPREERAALRRCRPKTLISILEHRFDTVGWQGICAFITHTAGLKRRVLDLYLQACRWLAPPGLYPRQAWIGIKRT